MKVLEGCRTYIVAAIMIALAIAKGQGWITSDTYSEIQGILIGAGFWFLRSGVSRI